ncbi:hypothetical protein [Leptolyngbya sp. PCC 6406]|uniref:hypothetical protein n=1 Tax=Leptolyngbya sp. PCC 6406 TaxID=1173264 RepID=UPI0002AC4BFB|nr:hypothetical protein [Leptolyngbya sp. PCC 6406]
MTSDEAIRHLRERWKTLTATRIPPRIPDDLEAEDLRGDIIGYDSHVAGVVSSILAGSPIETHWLKPRSNLLVRARSLTSRLPDTNAYLDYIVLLDEVLGLAATAQPFLGGSD